jgi:probable HAF family extracellular repeat protein
MRQRGGGVRRWPFDGLTSRVGAEPMKIADLSRYALGICAAVAILAGCGGSQTQTGAPGTMPQIAAPQSAATSASGVDRTAVHYRIVQLPTLGGSEDFANWINDRGWVAGAADLAGGRNEHAFLWRDNTIRDLGTLGGRNSLAWPVNDAGEVGGSSETSAKDPYNENYCNFIIDGKPEHSTRTCLGFMWSHGTLTALPTLGGNNDGVQGLNNRGQFVGDAETSTVDRTCMPPQVLDFEAVIWGPHRRQIQKLPPFAGDAVGVALAINENGEVVGGSGICAPISPAIGVHAILWQHGSPKYLGGFGGQMNNVAFDINNRRHIVGFSDLTGDTATHAFLWKNGKMTDLGTLPGDVFSFAFGINERDQIVGQSCDASFNCRAFIWQDDVMHDLNALVRDSSVMLTLAESINRDGEITGIAYDPASGGIPAYVAIPKSGGPDVAPRSKTFLPADVRTRLQQMSSARI